MWQPLRTISFSEETDSSAGKRQFDKPFMSCTDQPLYERGQRKEE